MRAAEATLLAAPALFYAHGVLAGWLLFTYHNPQLDRQDKVDNWGCSLEYALVRTVAAHVMPVVAHWAVARSELAEHRAAHGSFWSLLLYSAEYWAGPSKGPCVFCSQ